MFSRQDYNHVIATAETVDDDELMKRAEGNILSRAAFVEIEDHNAATTSSTTTRRNLFLGGLALVFITATVIGLALALTTSSWGGSSNKNSNNNNTSRLVAGTVLEYVDASDKIGCL